jgi:hypothetical protein
MICRGTAIDQLPIGVAAMELRFWFTDPDQPPGSYRNFETFEASGRYSGRVRAAMRPAMRVRGH